MLKQIITSALVAVGLLSTVTPALSQSQPAIPNGYVLVPLSTFSASTASMLETAEPQVASVAPSAEKSLLRISDEFGFAGRDNLRVTAILYDEDNRPIAGRTVSLISSRSGDKITAITPVTNSHGEAIFSITGHKEGVSTLTAIDQASNTVLTERTQIVFLKNNQSGIGGNIDLLKSDLVAEATSANTDDGTLDATYDEMIEVINFPAETTVNIPLDVTVQIIDLDGMTNENYTGTIMFDSTDPLAILPEPYTFTDIDQGEHTFYSAVTFATAGVNKILVSSDTATEPIELYITVNGIEAKIDAPIIDSPVSGSLLNQDSLALNGFTAPNSNLVVLIDDRAAQQTFSDMSGTFEVELTSLDDGDHALTVAILLADDTIGATSEATTITIDTISPELLSLTLEPATEIEIGTPVTITLLSETNLESAELFINDGDSSLSLLELKNGAYAGKLETTSLGEYSLRIKLTDRAGNFADFTDVGTLTVVEPPSPLTIDAIETEPADTRVNLFWEPPVNHAEVSYYIIQYGPVKDNPDQQFTTPDNRTAWYIDRLNNDTAYYFQITSYDAENKMNGYSIIADETPRSILNLNAMACDTKIVLDWRDQTDEQIVRYQIAYGIDNKKYIETQNLPDRRTHWEIRNLINDVPYFFTIRGLDTANQVIFSADEEVSATPGGSACYGAGGPPEYPIQLWQKVDKDHESILLWNPVPGATAYKVYAGTEPNFFDLPTVTVTTPYLKPTNLLANQSYYFAVRAVLSDNHEAANFSNVLQLGVGPATLLALALLTAVSGSWLVRRKQKLAIKSHLW